MISNIFIIILHLFSSGMYEPICEKSIENVDKSHFETEKTEKPTIFSPANPDSHKEYFEYTEAILNNEFYTVIKDTIVEYAKFRGWEPKEYTIGIYTPRLYFSHENNTKAIVEFFLEKNDHYIDSQMPYYYDVCGYRCFFDTQTARYYGTKTDKRIKLVKTKLPNKKTPNINHRWQYRITKDVHNIPTFELIHSGDIDENITSYMFVTDDSHTIIKGFSD